MLDFSLPLFQLSKEYLHFRHEPNLLWFGSEMVGNALANLNCATVIATRLLFYI